MDKLEPLDDVTEERARIRPLGPVELMTTVGPVTYFDAVFVTNGPAQFPDGEQVATIMIAIQPNEDGPRWGGIAQFKPEEARTFAATLCQTADKIDGGGVKH